MKDFTNGQDGQVGNDGPDTPKGPFTKAEQSELAREVFRAQLEVAFRDPNKIMAMSFTPLSEAEIASGARRMAARFLEDHSPHLVKPSEEPVAIPSAPPHSASDRQVKNAANSHHPLQLIKSDITPARYEELDGVRFHPIFVSKGPGCPIVLRRLSNSRIETDGFVPIDFGEVQERDFRDGLPSAQIISRDIPLVVTTPAAARIAFEAGEGWAIGVPLAAQHARLVTRKDSALDVTRSALAKALGGHSIAVPAVTSAYTTRLVSIANGVGCAIELRDRPPRRRKRNTLYLIPLGFPDLLKEFLDGHVEAFATVEPFPTIARAVLGDERYAEVSLDHGYRKTSSDLCCVVAIPTAFSMQPAYAPAYRALAASVVTSACELLELRTFESIESYVRPVVEQFVLNDDDGFNTSSAAVKVAKHITWSLTQAHMDLEPLVEILAPEIEPRAMYAEREAIARFLPYDTKLQLRTESAYTQAQESAYNVALIREVYRTVLSSRLQQVVLDFNRIRAFAEDSGPTRGRGRTASVGSTKR